MDSKSIEKAYAAAKERYAGLATSMRCAATLSSS